MEVFTSPPLLQAPFPAKIPFLEGWGPGARLCDAVHHSGWERAGSSAWGLFVLAALVCSVGAAEPRAKLQ